MSNRTKNKIVETLSLDSLALGFLGGSSTLWRVSRQLWLFTSDFSSLLTLFMRFSGKNLSLYLGSITVESKNKLLQRRYIIKEGYYTCTVISRIQPSFESLFYTFCQAL